MNLVDSSGWLEYFFGGADTVDSVGLLVHDR